MKYEVCVRESSNGYISVEADSVEDAKEKAELEYENGNVYWKDSEFFCSSGKMVQERADSYDSR